MLDLLREDEIGLIAEFQIRIRFPFDSHSIRNVAGARRPRPDEMSIVLGEIWLYCASATQRGAAGTIGRGVLGISKGAAEYCLGGE